jgi:large subunit ribosomal protein L19e
MTYDLTLQKRIAGRVLKVGPKRVRFDPAKLNDIKAAITKHDIRTLIAQGVVAATPEKGVSRARAKKNAMQRSKGLRKGPGRREGKATARNPAKRVWINKVRAQRVFLKELKSSGVLVPASFAQLYRKSKGGFFRSVRHIKIYMNEQGLTTRPAKK